MEHFGRLATDMGESGLRRLIWSILGAWLHIWAKVASGGAFGAFWAPGHRYGPMGASKSNSTGKNASKSNGTGEKASKSNGVGEDVSMSNSTHGLTTSEGP